MATVTQSTGTQYVVLKDSPGGWTPVGAPVEAANDVAAIKAATADEEDHSGTFVAVPTRSWRPRTRAIETKQIDRWT